MRRFLRIAASYGRLVPVLAGLLGTPACKLTEAVRTIPGAPGEIGFGNGGTSPDAGAGGTSGFDGGGDARADGSLGDGSAHQGGRGGTSGRPNAGGATGVAGILRDG